MDDVIDLMSDSNDEADDDVVIVSSNEWKAGDGSIYFKSTIREVAVSDSVTHLETGEVDGASGRVKGVFQYCTKLETVRLPKSLRKIGEHAFGNCEALLEIDISTVSCVGIGAFSGCNLLKSVSLAENLTVIPRDAFYGCKSLKSVELPSPLKTIEEGAFQYCSLESINFDKLEALTYVGREAFAGNSFKSLRLPPSLKVIEDDTFYGCKSLSKVELPSSLERIGRDAFKLCNASSFRLDFSERCWQVKSAVVQKAVDHAKAGRIVKIASLVDENEKEEQLKSLLSTLDFLSSTLDASDCEDSFRNIEKKVLGDSSSSWDEEKVRRCFAFYRLLVKTKGDASTNVVSMEAKIAYLQKREKVEKATKELDATVKEIRKGFGTTRERTKLRKLLIEKHEGLVESLGDRESLVNRRSTLEGSAEALREGSKKIPAATGACVNDVLRSLDENAELLSGMAQAHKLSTSTLDELRRWSEPSDVLSTAKARKRELVKALAKHKQAELELESNAELAALGEESSEASGAANYDEKLAIAAEESRCTVEKEKLDEALTNARKDLRHFPELQDQYFKLMGFSSDFLEKYARKSPFDDYEIVEELGDGVYKARGGDRREFVILKSFKAAVNEYREYIMKIRELQHPSIMPLIGVFIDGDAMFIEMPFCEGGDLLTYVRDQKPGISRLRVILSQVLDGIIKMHDNGIIHGDIKPNNVLMTNKSQKSSRPKLTGFVTACTSQDDDASDVFFFGKLLAVIKGVLREVDVNEAGKELDEVVTRCTIEEPCKRPSAAEVKEFTFFTHAEEAEKVFTCCICTEEHLQGECIFCSGSETLHCMCKEDFNMYVKTCVNEADFASVSNSTAGVIHCCHRGQGCDSAPFSDDMVSLYFLSLSAHREAMGSAGKTLTRRINTNY